MGYTALAEAQGLADPIPVTVTGERVDTRPALPTLPKVAPDTVAVSEVGRGGWVFTPTAPANPTPEPRQPQRDGNRYRGLSPRHVEVLQELANTGGTNAEIGAALGLTEMTIKTHLRHAAAKLGARDRAHAVVLALRDGWIT